MFTEDEELKDSSALSHRFLPAGPRRVICRAREPLALVFTAHGKEALMKAGNFDDLTLADKFWLVREYGLYLTSVEYYDYRVSLHSLNAQLIEVYKNIDTGIIERISVAQGNDLNKFLARILIGNLKSKMKR